jgi:hypothetical protein
MMTASIYRDGSRAGLITDGVENRSIADGRDCSEDLEIEVPSELSLVPAPRLLCRLGVVATIFQASIDDVHQHLKLVFLLILSFSKCLAWSQLSSCIILGVIASSRLVSHASTFPVLTCLLVSICPWQRRTYGLDIEYS